MTKKLLSGDDDFDLFLVSDMERIYNLMESSYLLPLDKLGTGVTSLYDGMLPGVKELCSAEGRIVFVPLAMQFEGLSVSTEVMQALDLQPGDFPRTADEFITFVNEQSAAIADTEYGLFSFIGARTLENGLMKQYTAEYFENENGTDAAWDAMTRLLDVADAHSKPLDEEGFHIWRYLIMPGDMTFVGNHKTHKYYSIPCPLLTESSKNCLSQAMLIGVNPNSRDLDTVVAFLECLLSESYFNYVAKKMATIMPEEQLKSMTGQDYWPDYNSVRWGIYELPGIDPAQYPFHNVYKEMLQNAAHIYPDQLSDLNTPFFQGEITTEEWRTRIDRELEFLRDE